MLELPENHSVPERTIGLRAHGQLESIDFLNLNHFTRRGLRSPRGSLIVSCALTDNGHTIHASRRLVNLYCGQILTTGGPDTR